METEDEKMDTAQQTMTSRDCKYVVVIMYIGKHSGPYWVIGKMQSLMLVSQIKLNYSNIKICKNVLTLAWSEKHKEL